MTEFKKVAADFADLADFVTVYIKEPHPSDGFDFSGNRYKIKQHVSLQDRVQAANMLLNDEAASPPGVMYIDKLDNQAAKLYGVFAERLYIVLDGVIVYQGILTPFGYHVCEVREWLEKFQEKAS